MGHSFVNPTTASFAAVRDSVTARTSAPNVLPFATLEGDASPAEALAAWAAVVSGRWEIVACVDAPGRRRLLAEDNADTPFRAPRLCARALDALALLGRGHAQKFIGYELDMSPARLSRLVGSARMALGIASRAELVRVASAALGGGCAPLSRWPRSAGKGTGMRRVGARGYAWAQPMERAEGAVAAEQSLARFDSLTHAERHVCLLAIMGDDDRAIAARRHTSARTVAVLMGRAFRKLGVHGRNELIVGYGSAAVPPRLAGRHDAEASNK